MTAPESGTAYNFKKMPETRSRLSAVFHRPGAIICMDYKELLVFRSKGPGGAWKTFPSRGAQKILPKTRREEHSPENKMGGLRRMPDGWNNNNKPGV